MRILVAPTENFILGEKTFFGENASSSVSTITVKNASNFKAGSFIVLGTIGNETTEIKQIDTIDEDLQSMTLVEATNFAHSKLEPIQEIRYNKRKFYRSDSEEGTFTHLSSEGSPVAIQVDIPEGTRFEDTTGTGDHYYKATYFNSHSGDESRTDDSIAAKASDVEHYTSIFKIRAEAGLLENYYITSDLIHSYRLEAEAEVEGMVANVYQLPFSYKPKILQHIVTLLAAGHLLSKEYGMEADIEISKSGERKIERANMLLEKIMEGTLLLIGEDGSAVDRRQMFYPSGSNTYDGENPEKGTLFNLEPEHFKMTDPAKPLSISRRRSELTERDFNGA